MNPINPDEFYQQYICFSLILAFVCSLYIIKLMMYKNTQITSSMYVNPHPPTIAPSTSTQGRSKRKIPYKIQFHNQNLQQAIKEVRSNIKDNPQWRLNVKAVVSQYPSKNLQSFANDSQRVDPLPPSNKIPLPYSTETVTQYEKLKFTQRKRKQYQSNIQEIKQKRMNLQVSLLQKQMRAKLQRKLKETMILKQKRELMREIQSRREQSMRMKEMENKKKKVQNSLLHQSNVASAKMIRRYRNRSHKQLLNDHKSRSEQSELNLHFRESQITKEKIQQREIILSRYKSLRSASQGSLRRKSIQLRTNSKNTIQS